MQTRINKILTLLITFIFCLSANAASCCLAFADGTEPEPLKEVPGIKILANGNRAELDPAMNSAASVTDESVYPGSSYSVKFKLSSALALSFDTDIDWTQYSTLNIRWRADMPGQVLNMIYANSDPINAKPYARIMGGPGEDWGEYSISVSRFADYYQYSDNGKCISYLQISGSGWNNTSYDRNCTVYIDSVYLKSSDSGKEMMLPVSNVDGQDMVNPDIDGDNSVVFTFEDKLYDADYSSAVTVTEDGSELSNERYNVYADGNELWITFKELLKDKSLYTVSLAGPYVIYSHLGKVLKEAVTKEFTVEYGSGFVRFSSERLYIGDELTTQFFADIQGCKRVVNVYNTDRRLLLSETPADAETDSVVITIPDNAAYVKAYIEDESGITLYYALLDINGKGNVSLGDALPKLISAQQRSGTVVGVDATGKASAGNVPVMVIVYNPDGTELIHEPVATASDGSFVYRYDFGEENISGKYKVRFIMAGEEADYSIAYVDPEASQDFTELANSGSVSKLKAWMKENMSLIPDSFSAPASVDDAALILVENSPYDTYDELYEVLVKINETLDTLNNILWSDLADYITENNGFLMEEDSSDYAYFAKLSAKNCNLICKDIVKDAPFGMLSDFRSSFERAVKSYKSDNSSGKSSGGSGSSGGKTTSRTSITAPVMPPVQPSVPDTPMVSPEQAPADAPFIDLAGYEWAKQDITTLYSKGIISPSADKCYRPYADVKREELVKMIVEAFVTNKAATSHLFTDSDADAWYNSYLAAAFDNGIVLGRPDGSFGTGESITREDMVVMVYRAINSLGVEFALGDVSAFSDSAYISEYASEAVGAMTASGIIGGMGDGSFAPKAYANRAQVAGLIARLIKTYEGSVAE